MSNHKLSTTTEKFSTNDCGAVRLGNMSPAFKVEETKSEIADKKNVRLGNMSPAFKVEPSPKETKDGSHVRLGNMSPAFRV